MKTYSVNICVTENSQEVLLGLVAIKATSEKDAEKKVKKILNVSCLTPGKK